MALYAVDYKTVLRIIKIGHSTTHVHLCNHFFADVQEKFLNFYALLKKLI